MRLVLRLAAHEVRLLTSLVRWVARRPHLAGGRAFGYARGEGAVLFGFAFVCVVETFTMSVLLRGWPTVHAVVLFLDVYTVVVVIGLHAASVVRPHLLEADALRVRYAAHVDLRIPLAAVSGVRRELRTSPGRRAGELDVAVGHRTSVTLELAEPVTHVTFLGQRREVTVVRLHADDDALLVAELTRARNGSSPIPGRPG
ncbi:hypothetical protein RKD23_005312 [Streptomyces sp. SAI-170]|uniref:hypothetical protein n=1 Tax=Streptomyces sp. SAI-170 TaxID=3377729 RepID=UPI003C7EB2CF